MKSNSIDTPTVLLSLGDGNWHVNYNIQTVTKEEEDGTETQQYEYDTVFVAGTPTVAKIVAAIVHESYTDEDIEMMNALHQAAQLGLGDEPQGYSAYLALVVQARAQAVAAMNEYGQQKK